MQVLTPEQLAGLSLAELNAKKAEAEARKAELSAKKEKGGKAWTDALQEELNSVALYLVDLDDAIAEAAGSEGTETKDADKKKQKVQLEIVRGRRFNPTTGKEISKPITQSFSFAEWQTFKKNYSRLGYSILKVINDPYGDAAELVVKN